jgi:hypothetical protein
MRFAAMAFFWACVKVTGDKPAVYGHCVASMAMGGEALCEAGDELSGERENLVEVERGVEGFGEW